MIDSPMKKITSTFIFVSQFLFCIHSSSQIYRPTNKDIVLAVRGKVGLIPLPEDGGNLNATIGSEIVFMRRHSIGVDFTISRWGFQTDDATPQENIIYSQYEKRTYTYFDYKLRLISAGRCCFYFNAYEKTGLYNMWYERFGGEFGSIDSSIINNTTRGIFHEPGLGIGLKYYFNGEGSGWGLDFSLNACRKFYVNDIREYAHQVLVRDEMNVRQNSNGCYLRINLFYQFGDEEDVEFRKNKNADNGKW